MHLLSNIPLWSAQTMVPMPSDAQRCSSTWTGCSEAALKSAVHPETLGPGGRDSLCRTRSRRYWCRQVCLRHAARKPGTRASKHMVSDCRVPSTADSFSPCIHHRPIHDHLTCIALIRTSTAPLSKRALTLFKSGSGVLTNAKGAYSRHPNLMGAFVSQYVGLCRSL